MAEQILFAISSFLIIAALIFAVFLKERTAALYFFASALALKVIKEIFIKEDFILAITALLFMCFILFLARREKKGGH